MVKMIMHGCNGAMGQVISKIVEEDENITIAAGIDVNDTIQNSYPVFPSLEACTVEADVIVDFASAKAVNGLLSYCSEKRIPVVVCTLKLVKEAAEVLAESGFDIEILEKHHNKKVDAPSGTALALADSINEAMDNHYHYQYDRSQTREKRQKDEIGIQAIRGGSIVGEHDVIFAGQDEVITFQHTAYSKAIFAKGAVSAAKFLVGKEPRLYTMADVIG